MSSGRDLDFSALSTYALPRARSDLRLAAVGFRPLLVDPPASGLWRSLVAHLTGGQVVAGSNPVSPTERNRL